MGRWTAKVFHIWNLLSFIWVCVFKASARACEEFASGEDEQLTSWKGFKTTGVVKLPILGGIKHYKSMVMLGGFPL